jgi:hypothetical protein
MLAYYHKYCQHGDNLHYQCFQRLVLCGQNSIKWLTEWLANLLFSKISALKYWINSHHSV